MFAGLEPLIEYREIDCICDVYGVMVGVYGVFWDAYGSCLWRIQGGLLDYCDGYGVVQSKKVLRITIETNSYL